MYLFKNPNNKLFKALISLCVVGLAAAAPQAGQQEVIVSQVITSLEQPIAIAVANALASLNRGSSSSYGSTSSSSGSFSSSGSVSGAVEEPTAPAKYDFKYQVADEPEQTYITHEESRDGDEVTGSYSYVDATGALITVNYQAGAMGYNVIGTDKQEGYVQIRARPTSSVGLATGSVSSGNRNTVVSSGVTSSSSSSSSSLNEDQLIAQILAALTPQINSAVTSALGATTRTTSFRQTAAPVRTVVSSVAGDRLTPFFGN